MHNTTVYTASNTQVYPHTQAYPQLCILYAHTIQVVNAPAFKAQEQCATVCAYFSRSCVDYINAHMIMCHLSDTMDIALRTHPNLSRQKAEIVYTAGTRIIYTVIHKSCAFSIPG